MTTGTAEYATVEITGYAAEAKGVVRMELRHPERAPLPAFTPGSHLEVLLPNGLVRHYSLTNDYRETDRYVVAVTRVADSEGGSSFIHEQLTQGMRLQVSAPRNNFALDPDAPGYLFISGGIGITPILSMVRWSIINHKPWQLVYAARSRQRAAFYEDIRALDTEHVHWHFDDEEPAYLDMPAVLRGLRDGELVYCCGPDGLMQAVRTAVAGYPKGIARFEVFSEPPPAPGNAAAPANDDSFEVEIKSSGQRFAVPPDKSILEVLEENGFSLPFSCREGMCGTCIQGVCAGRPEHRDYVQTEEEHEAGKLINICVSRSRDPVLVLDL